VRDYATELMLLRIKDLISAAVIAGFAVYTINILGFPETSGYIAGAFAIFALFFLLAEVLPLPEDSTYDE
jgi:hypothetical protein